MTRRAFYSFHYQPDSWRVAQVRSIGSVEGNPPVHDNVWEDVKKGGDAAIRKWIAEQMKSRSCTVVLVGSNTANRKWVQYEIEKSWRDRMGVVGIHIHGLKDKDGHTSFRGANPFTGIRVVNSATPLSSIVKCYDPEGLTSRERYRWISRCLASAVEEAIRIRQSN